MCVCLCLYSASAKVTEAEIDELKAFMAADDIDDAQTKIQDKEDIPPDQHDSDMQIFVKFLSHETITIHVETYNTIDNVKAMIKNKIGIPKCQQRLIFEGNELEDSTTLEENNIHEGDALYHVLASVL